MKVNCKDMMRALNFYRTMLSVVQFQEWSKWNVCLGTFNLVTLNQKWQTEMLVFLPWHDFWVIHGVGSHHSSETVCQGTPGWMGRNLSFASIMPVQSLHQWQQPQSMQQTDTSWHCACVQRYLTTNSLLEALSKQVSLQLSCLSVKELTVFITRYIKADGRQFCLISSTGNWS